MDDILNDPYEDDDGGWPRCVICNHMAQSHDTPEGNGEVVCEGDEEGQSCNCVEYVMPEGWSEVDGKPVLAVSNDKWTEENQKQAEGRMNREEK